MPKQTPIPALVRVKPGVLDRIGHYAERQQFLRVRLFFSEDLNSELTWSIQIVQLTPVSSIAFENVAEISAAPRERLMR